MDREAMQAQMKAFKTKAKAARKAGKADIAAAFKNRERRLSRELRATKPREVKKAEG